MKISRILVFALLTALVLSILPVENGRAAVLNDSSLYKVYYGNTDSLNDSYSAEAVFKNYGAATDPAYWDQFSDRFFYNSMNDTQKLFYDRLAKSCYNFMFTDMDASTQYADYKGVGQYIYVLPGIPNPGLNQREALDVFIIFSNANPHYYFLSSGMLFGSENMIYCCVYDKYANGSIRSNASVKLKTTIDEWISKVNKGATLIEKERNIYSFLGETLVYYNGPWDDHQSIATAMLSTDRKTVCAGYSESFALLCKAVGIDCLVITSNEHEWNQVKLGDYWYNVDLTLDDSGAYPNWKYFNKSDAFFDADGFHRVESIYNNLGRPKCLYDYGSEPGLPVPEPEPEPMPGPEPIVTPVPESETVEMHRLLNPETGEHLYTQDIIERDTLIAWGWVYEGVAWKAPTSKNMGSPVFRLFNPISGEHHYTMDGNEKDTLCNFMGWQNEGIKWYSWNSDGVPVYRVFNPGLPGLGAHHYTTDIAERDALVSSGSWYDEGVSWYGANT